MDVARTARRLGATDAVVVYRRTRETMPAHPIGGRGVAGGVRVRWLSTIAYAGTDTIRVERMRWTTRRPQPTGEFDELTGRQRCARVGQDVDRSLLGRRPMSDEDAGLIGIGPNDDRAGGVFAGGDAVAGDRTVTSAVGHGKRAARQIDAWLRGVRYEPATRPPRAPIA